MELTIENVTRDFSSEKLYVRALENVSFDVEQGQFVSLLGPSGCGKSTLLRLVAGLLSPTEGRVLVSGVPVLEPPGNIGFVFQNPVLLKWRTVMDNIMFPYEVLASQGRAEGSKSDYEDRARYLIEMTRLEGFGEAYPKQLSGGMRQRVSICRALLTDPDLLLMDEPFGSLDQMTREHLNDELLDIWQKTGKTILFVTHQIPESVFLSDKIVVLTGRPGTVSEIVDIDIGRSQRATARDTPEFLGYTAHLRSLFDEK